MCGEFWSDVLSQLLATIIGVVIGAYLAFEVERRKERGDENRRRAAAVNLTLLKLGQMYSAILQYGTEVVEPARKSKAIWYEMKPASIHTGTPPTFDYGDLQFLFSSPDPNALGSLAIEELRFARLVELVERRSKMHHEEMQAAVERGGITTGPVDIRVLEGAVGPRVVQSLRDYSDSIIEFIDKGIVSTLEVAEAVRKAALGMVGGEKIIQITPRQGTQEANR